MSEFKGKVVVVTGGGGGIGKAAAARFLDEGASVVLSSRRFEVLEAARRELAAEERTSCAASRGEHLGAKATARSRRYPVVCSPIRTGRRRPSPNEADARP